MYHDVRLSMNMVHCHMEQPYTAMAVHMNQRPGPEALGRMNNRDESIIQGKQSEKEPRDTALVVWQIG